MINNKKYKHLLLLVLSFTLVKFSAAQNCSVNSGINLDFCEGEPMEMDGLATGLFKAPNDVKWTQTAGPSVLVDVPSDVKSNITGATAGNSYTFRISGTCEDGVIAQDDVTYTVLPITQADAGPDQVACPGIGTMAGNAPVGAETGSWQVLAPNAAGVSGLTASPTSSFTTSTTAAGTSQVVWTINSPNGCITRDTVEITNYGGEATVSVTPNDVILTNCYSSTQCYDLNGSFGGNGLAGQQGTWSMVSGPTQVTFGDVNDGTTQVCGMSEGCYKLRWDVTGGCASGSDTILICVPAPTQSTTIANSVGYVRVCDGRTSITLTANQPTYATEIAIWEFVSGPFTPTIVDSASSITQVTGLNNSSLSEYLFRYTITDTATGCTSSDLTRFRHRNQMTLDPIAPVTVACGLTSVDIPYNPTWGGRYQLASAPVGYTGTVNGNYVSDNSPINLTNLDVPGTYVYNIRRSEGGNNIYGCVSAIQQMQVSVSDEPLGANAGTDQLLPCGTISSALAGNTPPDGVLGTWTQVSGPNTLQIDSIHNPASPISGFANGVYVLRWSLNGGTACPALDDEVRVVFFDQVPQGVDAGADATICYGGSARLAGSTPLNGEVGTWSVTPNSGVAFSDANDPNATVTGLDSNTAYTFTWDVVNRCGSDDASVTLTTTNVEAPTAADAGGDQCLASGTSSATLAGNSPAVGTGVWAQVSGPAATITNNTLSNTTVTGLVDGTYEFEWRTTNATCDPSLDTVMITISAPASAAMAGDNADSCSNSYTMSATAPIIGEGEWVQTAGPAGWEVDDINSPTARFTSLVSGTYKFDWVVTNGACSGSTDEVVINIDNVPTFPFAEPEVKLCGTGNTVELNGLPVMNGNAVWAPLSFPNLPPTINSPTSDSTTTGSLSTGIYQFTRTAYSVFGICPSFQDTLSDTIVISAGAGSDRNICITESAILLTGNGNSTGIWSQVSGGAVTLDSSGTNTAIVSDFVPGTLIFEYEVPSIYGCPATLDSITLVVDDSSSSPNAGVDQELCQSASITLAGNDVSPSVGRWTKTFGPSASITDNSLFNTTVTGMSPGLYLFQWTSTNNTCNLSDEMRVEIFEAPTVTAAGTDQAICPEASELTGNAITTGIGNWYQVGTLPSVATIDQPVNPSTAVSGLNAVGTYQFEWVSTNGVVCPASRDTIDIVIADLNPDTAKAGIDSSVCGLDMIDLYANTIGFGTGAWSGYASNPSTSITDASSPTTNVDFTTEGTYGFIWTSTNGGCEFIDSVEIVLSDSVVDPFAGNDTTFCIESAITLNAGNPTPQTGAWSQLSGPATVGYVDQSAYNTGIFGATGGTYEFVFEASNGSCPEKTDTVEIIVNSSCFIDLSGNLFNDVDGLTDMSIDGNLFNDPEGTPVYVSLLNSNGMVIATAPIAADGSYQFLDIDNDSTYSLVIHTNPSGSTTPDLPANWVNTGDNVGAGANGDGTNNGIITGIMAMGVDITDVNFGIQERPETDTITAPIQSNPGMGNLVTVDPALFGGIDTSAGTTSDIDSIRLTTFPTNIDSIIINGVSYTSATWPAGGVAIPTNASGEPAWTIQIDPIDGSPTADIPYTTIDQAGYKDLSPGYVKLPFGLSLSGNVFNDGNGLTDSTVNGSGINNPSGTQLYANLLNAAGEVIATTPIAADGSYSFDGLTENTDYSVIIDVNAQTVGATGVAGTLPTDWIYTGDTIGTGTGNDGSPNGQLDVSIGTVDQPEVNFGIEQLPDSDDKTYVLNPSPTLNSTSSLTSGNGMGALSGSDNEDGTQGAGDTLIITDLSGMNGNVLFYDADGDGVLDPGEEITVGDTIKDYDPAKLSVSFEGVGSTDFSFDYAWIDNAGNADPTPATYDVSWTTPVPVTWLYFTAKKLGDDVVLDWSTASELNNSGFEVYISLDRGGSFEQIGFVEGQGTTNKVSKYQYLDKDANAMDIGQLCYRLNQVDFDGVSDILIKLLKQLYIQIQLQI